MRTASAGTIESMDCLVTVAEVDPGSGLSIHLSGASAARFASAMEKKIREVLASLGIKDLSVTVQDNGALDLVLASRLEAAIKRLEGGEAA